MNGINRLLFFFLLKICSWNVKLLMRLVFCRYKQYCKNINECQLVRDLGFEIVINSVNDYSR